jgi:predicted CXXCH cytochrome family protein
MRRWTFTPLPRPWKPLLFLGLGLFLFAMAALASPAQATPSKQGEEPTNDFCLACHQQEDVELTLGAESISVTINPTAFGLSVHAEEGMQCVDCHSNISDYPHPAVTEKSVRDFSLGFSESCRGCHEEQYSSAQDGVHQRAISADNENAPLCSDCHNPHTQSRVIGTESGQLTIAARLHIPQTCAECHADKYEEYKASVHGRALTEEGNLDVPTCTDCHGVHNIEDPTTAAFRNNTPALCADCHDNAEIMDKYGISTNVLETYVADFHGTNVKLFGEQSPDETTNKAVCTDCHGVHDISKVDNPETGIALRENLLVKCQECHPGATANFPGAWMSHYEPSPEHYPIVFYVDLFYKIMIPGIIGGMIFFILTDIYRRRINRAKGVKHT